MCGRAYETFTEEELWIRYEWEKSKKNPLGNLKPNYNLCPTQLAPVIFIKDGQLAVDLMRWGLVPFWAKTVKDADKYSLINCKAEEIDEKRSYKDAFKKRRCIVPVSGFFEWKREGKALKRPFAIQLSSSPIMSIAGIYEHWVSKETGETVSSFAIVTTRANSMMEQIHTRMPVILAKENEREWLDPNNQDIAILKTLLKPCSSEWLNSYEVSTKINSPKNNSADLLNRLTG